MNLRATYVGELAARALERNKAATVTRVFQRSAYLKAGGEFILLLWGELRSPMTVNVRGEDGAGASPGPEAPCTLSTGKISYGGVSITLRRAKRWKSGLLRRRPVIFPSTNELAKGVAMLRSLYDVSTSGPLLVDDRALKSFVRGVLLRLASGDSGPVYAPESYLPLIGRGGGFTPAGDDFVGGFASAYNYIARCRRSKQVILPRSVIGARTMPESAAILGYSARGYVDEGMERLILRSLEGRGSGIGDDLLSVARRGHTSGMDMSLGVLLCEAALRDRPDGNALKECLGSLWNR